ncbi:MAG: UbiA family prenyltransferase [Phycisphaerae bacterium]
MTDEPDTAPDPRPRSPMRAWAQLLRLPNLLTVPGDPVAGALLAGWAMLGPASGNIVWAIAASLCLYAAGLVANDWFDLTEDRRDRPSRPLPAGEVPPQIALGSALGLTFVGIGCGFAASIPAGLTAAVLAACVWAYDGGGKRLPVVGPLLMGACRAGSVWLGAAAVPNESMPWYSLMAAVVIGLYVAGVTSVARRETHPGPVSWRRWLPVVPLGLWAAFEFFGYGNLLLLVAFRPMRTVAFGLSGMAVVWAMFAARRLRQPGGASVPWVIGLWIRGLFPVQAGFAALAGSLYPWFDGMFVALLLLVLWPISAHLGRKFYAS